MNKQSKLIKKLFGPCLESIAWHEQNSHLSRKAMWEQNPRGDHLFIYCCRLGIMDDATKREIKKDIYKHYHLYGDEDMRVKALEWLSDGAHFSEDLFENVGNLLLADIIRANIDYDTVKEAREKLE